MPLYTLQTPGWGQNVKPFVFLKVVMLNFKLKGMERRAPRKQIFCPYSHPRPLGWGQKVKYFSFLKVVMLHIKEKFDLTHAPDLWDWVERSDF